VHSKGFPPIACDNATILILGSLPGQESLRQQRYYAQAQNTFWKIMGRLFGAGPELPYLERSQRLMTHGLALWDVCAAAQRPGSMDSAIRRESVVPNGFAAFFAAHPQIDLLCFNGAKAAELYRRAVLPDLPSSLRDIRSEALPSTSPAYASMSFEDKLARWSVALTRQ